MATSGGKTWCDKVPLEVVEEVWLPRFGSRNYSDLSIALFWMKILMKKRELCTKNWQAAHKKALQ